MRLRIILTLLFSLLPVAATELRNKDENSTGADDEVAAAIDHLLERLQKYFA